MHTCRQHVRVTRTCARYPAYVGNRACVMIAARFVPVSKSVRAADNRLVKPIGERIVEVLA